MPDQISELLAPVPSWVDSARRHGGLLSNGGTPFAAPAIFSQHFRSVVAKKDLTGLIREAGILMNIVFRVIGDQTYGGEDRCASLPQAKEGQSGVGPCSASNGARVFRIYWMGEASE